MPAPISATRELPAGNDVRAWKELLIAYYVQHAPAKAGLVNEQMLSTWNGRFPTLYANLVAKYEPAAESVAAAPATKKAGNGQRNGTVVGDFHDEFVKLVAAATPLVSTTRSSTAVDAKQMNAENGLETSTCVQLLASWPPFMR